MVPRATPGIKPILRLTSIRESKVCLAPGVRSPDSITEIMAGMSTDVSDFEADMDFCFPVGGNEPACSTKVGMNHKNKIKFRMKFMPEILANLMESPLKIKFIVWVIHGILYTPCKITIFNCMITDLI